MTVASVNIYGVGLQSHVEVAAVGLVDLMIWKPTKMTMRGSGCLCQASKGVACGLSFASSLELSSASDGLLAVHASLERGGDFH